MSPIRFIVAAVLTWAVTAPVVGQQRIPIERADDLPRHTYRVTSAIALMQDNAQFAALAEKLESDLRADLSGYDIRDRATLKAYYITLARLALRRTDDDVALAYLDSVRRVEDKPALRLVTGLLEGVLIEARRAPPEQLEARFRTALGREVEALPYDQVQAELRTMKGNFELLSPNAILGFAETMVGPAAQSGEISRELAQLVVELRVALDVMRPVRDVVIEILGLTIAAHAVEKPDIWAERDVSLEGAEELTPVVVGIWDTGIDVSLFESRLYVNAGEVAGNGRDDDGNGFVDDVHGIAYDLEGEPTTGDLFPHDFDAAQEAEYRGYAKGLGDALAGLETPEATAFKQMAASLPPDRFTAYFENVNQYFFFAHGTHVAGIAARDNPAVRLQVARFASDEFKSPPSPPTLERSRRAVEAVRATVEYFERSGVRVVNMSWGYRPTDYESLLEANNVGADAAERSALARQTFDMEAEGLRSAIASAPGILFVAAAGNEDEDNRFGEFIPSSLDLPNLISVGAVDRAGDEAAFTSYGAVHVYANGYEVPSFVPGGEVQRFSGTSMAAPQVVNLAAKLLALKPELTIAELRRAIVEAAEEKAIGQDKRIRLLNPKASLERVMGAGAARLPTGNDR